MKPVVKGLLIGCMTVVALAVIAIVAFGWYVKRNAPRMKAAIEATSAHGTEFGRTASEPQCVNESLTRYQANPTIMNGVSQGFWLEKCLDTSAFDENFCTDVPPEEEILKSSLWRVSRCSHLGGTQDAACRKIIERVQTYCAGEVRRAKG